MTNDVKEDVTKVVELYVQGHTVFDAIKMTKNGLRDRVKLERDLKEFEELRKTKQGG